jgi:hypothetical protein
MDLPGQTPQLGKQAFKSLPDCVCRISIDALEILPIGSLQFELNQQIQLSVSQVTPGDTTVQKVTELRVPLERLLDRKRVENVITMIQERVFPLLAASPLEGLAFHGAGNGEGEMGLPDLQVIRPQELEQDTEHLLRDVFLRKSRSVPGHAANRSMQHRHEYENEKTLDECRPNRAKVQQFAEQAIGACSYGRSPENLKDI